MKRILLTLALTLLLSVLLLLMASCDADAHETEGKATTGSQSTSATTATTATTVTTATTPIPTMGTTPPTPEQTTPPPTTAPAPSPAEIKTDYIISLITADWPDSFEWGESTMPISTEGLGEKAPLRAEFLREPDNEFYDKMLVDLKVTAYNAQRGEHEDIIFEADAPRIFDGAEYDELDDQKIYVVMLITYGEIYDEFTLAAIEKEGTNLNLSFKVKRVIVAGMNWMGLMVIELPKSIGETESVSFAFEFD